MEKAWISSLTSILLLIAFPSSQGHWAEAFGTHCLLDFDYDLKEGLMEKNLELSYRLGVDLGVYGPREERQGLQPYVRVWESEIRFMAAVAAQCNDSETGGEVYGLKSHGERPVIMLATPPGRNAIHEVAWFRQDMDFFKKVNAFLGTHFGIQYQGPFHSHHNLGLEELSGVDIKGTHNIASKNGFKHLTQFVVTFENKRSCAPSLHNQASGKGSRQAATELKQERRCCTGLYARVKDRFIPSRPINFIRIHSFFFPAATHGKPVRCPIRIIPGTSPFRRGIMRNSLIPELTKAYTFPMDRILIDSFTPPDEPSHKAPELPARISEQFFQLPEDLRENTGVVYKDGLILLSLPLPLKKEKVFVAYNDKPPHRVEAVYFSQNGKAARPTELTKTVLRSDPHTALARIYERVFRLVEGKSFAGRSDKFRGTGEEVKSQEGAEEQEIVHGSKEPGRVENEEVL